MVFYTKLQVKFDVEMIVISKAVYTSRFERFLESRNC